MNNKFLFLAVSLLLSSACFGREQSGIILDAKTKKQTVDSVCVLLVNNYVFPAQGIKMANLLRKNLKSGIYAKVIDPEEFADKLTADLRSISRDLHLLVQYGPEQIVAMRNDTLKDKVPPEMIKGWKQINYGFVKTEYLPGNIGYLELRVFTDPKMPEAGMAAASAMNSLANAQAIIFDLRKNGGGYGEMVQLISSYLFADVTHLTDIYERPGNTTQQSWTLPYIPGTRLPDIPVYILTSNNTFSGAEEFSNNLKELKRATIIGETTGGGAHPIDYKIVNDLFMLKLPFARAINPISKSNWEGTGVIPHVKVLADSAFNVAYLMALDTLISRSRNQQDSQSYKNIRLWKQAEFGNYKVPEDKLKGYAGTYGPRTIIYENGGIYLLRPQRSPSRLLPLSDTEFMIDALGVKITFTFDRQGNLEGFDYTKPTGESAHYKLGGL